MRRVRNRHVNKSKQGNIIYTNYAEFLLFDINEPAGLIDSRESSSWRQHRHFRQAPSAGHSIFDGNATGVPQMNPLPKRRPRKSKATHKTHGCRLICTPHSYLPAPLAKGLCVIWGSFAVDKFPRQDPRRRNAFLVECCKLPSCPSYSS